MKWIVESGSRREVVQVGTTREGKVVVSVGGQELKIDLHAAGCSQPTGREYSAIVNGRQVETGIAKVASNRYAVSIDGNQHEVTVYDELTFLAHRSETKKGGRSNGSVTAYMPGKVVTVLIKEGDTVTAGQGVLVLEAMKMENEIQAEMDGIVGKLHVEAGEPVEGGDPLFDIQAHSK